MEQTLIHSIKKSPTKAVFILILVIGLIARTACFGNIPAGVHQDEAFAAYESYCLSKDGMDTWGYTNPMYLTTWGSGMSVMLSILMIPWVKLFGLTVWAIRMPTLLLCCLTLPAFYGCMRRMFNTRVALIAFFLLAINPWHISMSRWAIDANLAPAFLIFALYFFLLGLENSRFYLISAILYGFCLYTYVIMWMVVPIILVCQLFYLVLTRQILKAKPVHICLAVLIVLIFAIPAVLFMLVNYDMIPEIRTAFLSVPKLRSFRNNDISTVQLWSKIYNNLYVMFFQSDSLAENGTRRFGMYYHISDLFIPLGIVSCILRLIKKEHRASFLLIQFVAAVPLFFYIVVFIHRINAALIPMIGLCAVGIDWLCSLVKKHRKGVQTAIISVYFILFVAFEHYYFTDYKDLVSITFLDGLEDAVTEIKASTSEDDLIYVYDINYTPVLFYDKPDPAVFRETVEYQADSAFIMPKRFGRYVFPTETIEDVENKNLLTSIPKSYQEPFSHLSRTEYGWVALFRPEQ